MTLTDLERELIGHVDSLLELLRETPFCDPVYGDHFLVREAQRCLASIRKGFREEPSQRD